MQINMISLIGPVVRKVSIRGTYIPYGINLSI